MNFFVQIINQGIEDNTITDDIPANALAQTLWAQMTGVLQFIATKQKILEFTGIKAEDIINSQYEIIKRGLKK